MMYKYLSQTHKDSTKDSAGFSLIEVLVAVSVLLLIMVGPMTIIVQSSRSSSFATDQATAYFLAQEGIELAQNIRDGYQLAHIKDPVATPNPWDDFKTAVNDCTSSGGCSLEMGSGVNPTVAVASCSGTNPCRLYLDDGTGTKERQHFRYDDGAFAVNDKTKYKRAITITFSGDQAEVASTVTWKSEGILAESEVAVKTFLYDIYGN
ncbi:prepilin-type N-terminal cleavage/methylation domain-containing protein [Candidatus Kaiserbacteria bacterium]|nr:prepilin-type N-terminal cleavage/methylation domain-containing protein [Candidatus Kaiserbacteria bacterium]